MNDWSEKFNDNDKLEFTVKLCEHSKSYRICGKILNGMVDGLLTAEALRFVDDVISNYFFRDLTGKFKDFLTQLPELKDSIKALYEERNSMQDGELVDSDEDENGNLR